MLGWFADAPDPDAGLLGFRQVSDKLGATPWYLRLLRDETAVASRLAHVLGTSRYVTGLLLHAPRPSPCSAPTRSWTRGGPSRCWRRSGPRSRAIPSTRRSRWPPCAPCAAGSCSVRRWPTSPGTSTSSGWARRCPRSTT
nr:hypothetical protein GCM10020093_111690 [Planobispora longispora]